MMQPTADELRRLSAGETVVRWVEIEEQPKHPPCKSSTGTWDLGDGEPYRYPPHRPGDTVEVECPRCDGHGGVIAVEHNERSVYRCGDCHGTGHLRVVCARVGVERVIGWCLSCNGECRCPVCCDDCEVVHEYRYHWRVEWRMADD